jgi:hypothetical protein
MSQMNEFVNYMQKKSEGEVQQSHLDQFLAENLSKPIERGEFSAGTQPGAGGSPSVQKALNANPNFLESVALWMQVHPEETKKALLLAGIGAGGAAIGSGIGGARAKKGSKRKGAVKGGLTGLTAAAGAYGAYKGYQNRDALKALLVEKLGGLKGRFSKKDKSEVFAPLNWKPVNEAAKAKYQHIMDQI